MFDSSTFTVNESTLSSRISQAAYYLEQYEKEVARAQGASNYVFQSKDEALGRIKILKEFAPDDPKINELFERARACVKGGAGNITTVDPQMTVYLETEAKIRKHFADASEKAWNDLLAANTENRLEKVYPTPETDKYTIDDLRGKIVILDNVRYPDNQFMGVMGEYIYCGTRSDGMYFVNISGRDWLGPYEAVKRYRRLVDTTMNEVKEWTIIGEISDLACEVPDANEGKLGAPMLAWEVKPKALYVPGHIMAVYDENGEHTGRFIDEDQVKALKDATYTVKEVPQDVTPERLVEIFMYAIKEKNFDLYKECIDPKRQESPVQLDLMNYHWDLHQERFHGEYIHANINSDKTEIKVVGGFDDNSIDNFFLDESDVSQLKKAAGDKVEEAYVQTAAIDANGKQLGTPATHILKRTNGGRWYISTYEVRF